jgi:dienelactone hydrolase
MAVRTPDPVVSPRSGPHRTGGGWAATALLGTVGAALIVLLTADGSPLWRAARGLAVAALAGLAIWLAARSGRAGRGAVLLIAGIAGTLAGGGVASAQLRMGMRVTVAAALVALLAGLILLGWGAAALIRAMPGWWRLLAVPAALALLVFVLYPLSVAVNATNRLPGAREQPTPASRGLAYRDVWLRTGDGVGLAAWYLPSRNGAAVVLLPGAGSTRSAVVSQAAVRAQHGYGALLLDTRGHGRSGGHAMDFGWHGNQDIAAAVSWLAHRPEVRGGRIALLGLSMGGEQALVAAGSDRRIRAVVAEGVIGEQLADHGWLPQGPDGMTQRGLEWVMYSAAGLLSGTRPPMSIPNAIRAAAPRPELIIAGGAQPDEPVAARWFQAAAPASVRVWVAPGAGHTAALATDPAAWQARVTTFLDAALRPAGG